MGVCMTRCGRGRQETKLFALLAREHYAERNHALAVSTRAGSHCVWSLGWALMVSRLIRLTACALGGIFS